MRLATGLTAIVLAGCDAQSVPGAGLTRASRARYPVSCGGGAQPGRYYAGAAVEPFVAADPNRRGHLVGVWQQGRWSDGGANAIASAVSFDGGRTWAQSAARFSRCTGGESLRASDPWVSVGPDGTAHQIALVFNHPDLDEPPAPGADHRQAILVARSTDGGRSWAAPIAVASDDDVDVGLDKPAITADPRDPLLVYAVWNRDVGISAPQEPYQGPAWIARSTDGGATWEPPRVLYDPGPGGVSVGNHVVVLPDGALVDVFWRSIRSSAGGSDDIMVARSSDRGVSWSQPIVVDSVRAFGGVDWKSGGKGKVPHPVRTGEGMPHAAADPGSGALYVAWQDNRFAQLVERAGTTVGGDGIVLSMSTDGGLTWSKPLLVNQAPDAQAFTPSIAVAPDGTIGITYYDTRFDDPADRSRLLANAWLIESRDGTTWRETALGGAFDVRLAAYTTGYEGYFLGDYQGLAHDGNGFVPFFALTPSARPQEVADAWAAGSALQSNPPVDASEVVAHAD